MLTAVADEGAQNPWGGAEQNPAEDLSKTGE